MADMKRSRTKLQQDEVLSKIEFVCLDLVRQLSLQSQPSRLILRASDDDAQRQITINRRQGYRLACIMRCLAQVYRLLVNGQQSTKRDLFYDHKNLYKSQSTLDRVITSLCTLLDQPRVALNIISSSKGLLHGALVFMTEDQRLIDCRNQQVLISESLTTLRVISDAQFVLVIEKDAMFQKIIDEGYFENFPKSLLVTGKGYPDLCTRHFLRWLIRQLNIPIYGLFDGDPHGIEIMLTFKYGSVSECREGHDCNVKQIQWIGLKPSDVSLLPIQSSQFLKLCNRDFMKISKIRRRAQSLGEFEIIGELDVLYAQRSKLELEAISSIAPQFITRIYLMSRIFVLHPPNCQTIAQPTAEDRCHGWDNARRQRCVDT